MTKYFHELTDDERKALVNISAKEVAAKHPQPLWCRYEGALDGDFGCWSLLLRRVDGEGFCKGCDCYVPPDTTAQDTGGIGS